MTEIMVIRHAPALANEQGILMGAKLDSPLSDIGRLIARTKGEVLKSAGYQPVKVYTSELTRAKQTVEIILSVLRCTAPVISLAKLNERDFGDYDGRPYKYVLEAFEHEGDNPASVEPVESFMKRVLEAFELIKNETTGRTLVVTHSNPEMVMQTAVFSPDKLERFWELGDPPHCEGFTYTF